MQTVRKVIDGCPLWLYWLEILVRVFSEAREYRCNIARMVYDIESLDTIESIYSFIMGMLSVKKGGVADK